MLMDNMSLCNVIIILWYMQTQSQDCSLEMKLSEKLKNYNNYYLSQYDKE